MKRTRIIFDLVIARANDKIKIPYESMVLLSRGPALFLVAISRQLGGMAAGGDRRRARLPDEATKDTSRPGVRRISKWESGHQSEARQRNNSITWRYMSSADAYMKMLTWEHISNPETYARIEGYFKICNCPFLETNNWNGYTYADGLTTVTTNFSTSGPNADVVTIRQCLIIQELYQRQAAPFSSRAPNFRVDISGLTGTSGG